MLSGVEIFKFFVSDHLKCLLSVRISFTYDNTGNFLKARILFGVIIRRQIGNK